MVIFVDSGENADVITGLDGKRTARRGFMVILFFPRLLIDFPFVVCHNRNVLSEIFKSVLSDDFVDIQKEHS